MAENTSKKHEFQAEVKQVLDIVIHSLYTDKEVFVRELVSNASDALEKLRYLQLTGKDIYDENLPLEINIRTDDKENTVTIEDHARLIGATELCQVKKHLLHRGLVARELIVDLTAFEEVKEPPRLFVD